MADKRTTMKRMRRDRWFRMIHTNDYELGFGWRYPEMDQDGAEPDFSRYARDPMEHQRTAVLWLLRHARRALRRREV